MFFFTPHLTVLRTLERPRVCSPKREQYTYPSDPKKEDADAPPGLTANEYAHANVKKQIISATPSMHMLIRTHLANVVFSRAGVYKLSADGVGRQR